jgi:hypothetical protein
VAWGERESRVSAKGIGANNKEIRKNFEICFFKIFLVLRNEYTPIKNITKSIK